MLSLSKHAIENARERGISIAEIKKAVQRGAKHIQDGKVVSDYRHIRVVYKQINSIHRIITVMTRFRQ